MAGTFTGIALTQQNDLDGRPMAGAQLSIWVASTSTPQVAYSDPNLTVPLPWPVSADASGRFPMMYVPDGYYRLRVTDSSGETANGGFDFPSVPSIGPSTTGGAGAATDPATIMQTGDIKWRPEDGALVGWIRYNGRTIGSAVSGASERANADTASMFSYLWNNFDDNKCPVSGGRGVSAAADFAANKTITLLDLRGMALFGLDTMGSTAASRLLNALFTGRGATGSSSSSMAASIGGEPTHGLTGAENGVHTHPINVLTNPAGAHAHNLGTNFGNNDASGVGPTPQNGTAYQTDTQGNHQHSINSNTDASGSGTPHNNMPPFMLGTWYGKL